MAKSDILVSMAILKEETATAGAGIVRYCLGEHHLQKGVLLGDIVHHICRGAVRC